MNALFDHGHEVIYYTARGMGEFNQDEQKQTKSGIIIHVTNSCRGVVNSMS